jgi:hypothetical protein
MLRRGRDGCIDVTYLALGRGSAMAFLGAVPEDMYCFWRAGGAMVPGFRPLKGIAQERNGLEDWGFVGSGLRGLGIRYHEPVAPSRPNCRKDALCSRL